MPGGVAKESLITKGRVVDAAGETLERILTLRRISAGIGSVRSRGNRLKGRTKYKAAEDQDASTERGGCSNLSFELDR